MYHKLKPAGCGIVMLAYQTFCYAYTVQLKGIKFVSVDLFRPFLAFI